MPSRSRQHYRSAICHLLVLEALETRAMLAGNVTATVTRGTLLVRGDIEANEIIISQLPATGGYKITPVAESGTQINSGTVAVNFNAVLRLDIRLNGGNDKLGIGNDVEFVGELFEAISEYPGEEEGAQQQSLLEESEEEEEESSEEDDEVTILTFLGGGDDAEGFDIEDPDFTPLQLAQLPTRVTGLTSIDLGDGDDTLVAMVRSNSNLLVEGGKGSDKVLSLLSSVTHLIINTDPRRGEGMGDDLALVVLSNIRGDLAITTEAGDDGVLVLGTTVTNLGIGTGGIITGEMTDHDVVFLDSVSAADNIGVQTEVGDDAVYVEALIADNFRVTTGAGDDEVEIIGAALVALAIDTAAGEDWVSVTAGEDGHSPLVVRRNLTLNTGADDDTVEIDGGLLGLLVGGALDIRTGAGDDDLTLYHVRVGRSALIDTEAGNDVAILDSLDVRHDLTVNLGAGNDVLSIRNLSATRSSIRGGTGNDTLHDLGDHHLDINDTQFETTDEGAV